MDTPTVQTLPPPVTQPVPVPPPPKNNSGVLIGIFLVLLGILTGVALSKTTILSGLRIPYLSATPTPTPLASPKPTAEAGDPTADWKTYTNDTYGFSFKYPSDWKNITSTQAITNSNREFMLQTSRGEFVNGTVFDQRSKSPDTSWSKNILLPNDKELVIVYVDNIGPNSKGGTQDIQIFTQILSTFKFLEQTPTVSPTPAIPLNWKTHTFNAYGLTIYTPDDWQSSITDYPADSNSLVKFWKKSSPTIIPIQLDIKSSWDNTGNAESQPKNFMVDGSIPAYRMDPPTKDQQTLDRYQTNVYFEHNSKVYVFECVHNWTLDYVNTCNTMLSTLQFTQ